MDIEFKTLDELYRRIKPALYSKVKELKRKGISYIKEEDIWNYLSLNAWKDSTSLSLSEMVSSILHIRDDELKEYALDLLKTLDRSVSEEGELLWRRKNWVEEL